MRAEWTFLVGLVIGGAATFGVLSLGRGAPATPPDVVPETPGPARGPAEPAASLRVAPPPVEPSIPAPGSSESIAVVEVDLRDLAALAIDAPKNERNHMQVGATLAGAYARAGRPAMLRRVLSAGLASGMTIDTCLGFFGFLPLPLQAPAVTAFLAEHPQETPGAAALAWAWLRAGDAGQAFPPALEQLRITQGQDGNLLNSLFALDADRADAVLWRASTDWPAQALSCIVVAASSANRPDLVPRWAERLTRANAAVTSSEPTHADLVQEVARAEVAVREAPEDADRWVEVARARENSGDHKGAVQAWRAAIERSGPDTDLLREFLQADPAAAFPTIEAAARESQEDDLLLVHVEACLRMGRPEEAGASFWRMHRTEDLDSWWRSGIASLAPGPALARTERLLSSRAHRDDTDLRSARAEALTALGRTAAAYAEFLRREPQIGNDAQDGRVRADPAREAARLEARRAAPDADDADDDVTSRLALALWRAGRADAARAVAEPVVARYETGPAEKIYDAASVRLGQVFPDRMLAVLRRAYAATPDVWRRWLALLLQALGRPAEARTLLEECLKQSPDDPALLVARGLCR